MAIRISSTETFRNIACSAALLASLAGTTLAQPSTSPEADGSQAQVQPGTTQKDENVRQIQNEVETKTNDQASEKQTRVREDAVEALQKAQHALVALDKGNADEALASVEQAIGKLQVILAISPDLALAPVGVEMTQLDVLATPAEIRSAIEDVQVQLRKGRVQEARHLLSMLGSEVVITETDLPLATFPEALASVAPLISAGKLDTARAQLAEALSTMVVLNHVIPLPLLRADILLEYAGELAAVSSRTDEQNKELELLFDSIDEQLEMARLLGYGTKEDFKEFEKEMKSIREKSRNGKSSEGLVDRIRNKIAHVRESIFK